MRVCFCGVVVLPGAWAAGSESRDDDEVNSEMVSVVEELELAVTLACGYPLTLGTDAVRESAAGCDGTPVVGGAG